MAGAEKQDPPVRRGRPAVLDRSRIVAAAREFDPATITMRAVADKLGVDRKALNYHVSDREGLLRLVAAEAFEAESAYTSAVDPADWRALAREFVTLTRDSLVALGSLAQYVRLDSANDFNALQPAEVLLEALLNEGFDQETAGRGVALLAEFAFASARDLLATRAFGAHPQSTELRRVLSDSSEQFGALANLLSSDFEALGDRQFAFGLEVLLAGLDVVRSTGA